MLWHTQENSRATRLANSVRHSKAAPIRCSDIIALVTFNTGARVLSPFVSPFDAAFAQSVHELPRVESGYTNLTAGIRTGLDQLSTMPRGLRKRMWVLSDGMANQEVSGLWTQVDRAVRGYVNINTVGFGDPKEFDRDLLMKIAAGTHAGKYHEATTVAAIGAVFKRAAGPRPQPNHKGEATVFVIDSSGSMFSEKMGGRPRIEVVRDSLFGLVRYKQQVWS